MIKAIITDLDDTLLKRDKSVSDFSVDTLKQCRKMGIKIIVATARSANAKQFVPFELFDGFALMNGAIAIVNNHKVYEKLMEPKTFIPILKKISTANIQAAVEMNGIHYSNFDVPNRRYVITNFDEIKEKSEKFYAIVDSPDKVEFVKKIIPEGLRVHFTEDNYALITHFESSKINAISAILDFWNISFENTVAFGDAANDIEMIQKCGIGVAMENALNEVKTIADEICSDCDNDGVARWLVEHIL